MSAVAIGQLAARGGDRPTPPPKRAAGTSPRRGKSCVRRHTYDIDSKQASIHAPLGDGKSLESSEMTRRALLRTAKEARRTSAQTTRYSQGVVTRVGYDALEVLLDPKVGFDHWSGTNDIAASELARAGVFCERQWQRVKLKLAELGFISFVHRSIKSGLSDRPGADQDIQISDLYWFSPANLKPWLRAIFDRVLEAEVRKAAAKAKREGRTPERRPLMKRDRPPRRIPALLNPVGWAKALAAHANATRNPIASYADKEAEALAFATRLARTVAPG